MAIVDNIERLKSIHGSVRGYARDPNDLAHAIQDALGAIIDVLSEITKDHPEWAEKSAEEAEGKANLQRWLTEQNKQLGD